MAEYEYKVIPVGGLSTASANVAGQLNRLGSEGWKIVATLTSNGMTRDIVLMREGASDAANGAASEAA
jgi:Domain of unknown function (DUF4177)